MSIETRSEALFRQFCRRAWWLAWRVRTRDTAELRRPDFVVWRWFRRAAVEVKQIDHNPNDAEQAARLNAGGIATFGGEPGGRLRDAIKDASAQLKSMTGGRWPGLVVLYDNTELKSYVHRYHIKTAMYGLETVVFQRTGLSSPMSEIVDVRFGPKRRTTETTGTAISAVCHLQRDVEGRPCLDIFHNVHASSHLNWHLWRGVGIRHFCLEEKQPGERQDWIPCP